MLKLELYWRGAPRGVALFEEPPRSPKEWGLTQVARVPGGFLLTGEDGRCTSVRHGDSARLVSGPFTLVASSVVAWAPRARGRLSDWPWLFIALLIAAGTSFAAFAAIAPGVEGVEAPALDPELMRRVRFFQPPFEPRRVPPRPRFRGSCCGCIHTADCIPGDCGRPRRRWPPPNPAGVSPALLRLLTAPVSPVVMTGQPRVSGTAADREAIAKIVKAHGAEITACYHRAKRLDAAPTGALRIEWTLDRQGTVERPRVAFSTMKSAGFAECVLSRLATWKFPGSPGGLRVLVPFKVAPASD